MNRYATTLIGIHFAALVSQTTLHAGQRAGSTLLASRILNETDLVIDGQIGNTENDSPSNGLVCGELIVSEVLYGEAQLKKLKLVWVKGPLVESSPGPEYPECFTTDDKGIFLLQRVPAEYVHLLKTWSESKRREFVRKAKAPIIVDAEQDYCLVLNFVPKDLEEQNRKSERSERAGRAARCYTVDTKKCMKELLDAIDARLSEDRKALDRKVKETDDNQKTVREKLKAMRESSATNPDNKPDAGDGK